MLALAVHHLTKNFGERCLFRDLCFDIAEHDRVGLVGANGCGKTTLFRMLTGEEPADSGEILLSKGTRLGYLSQHTLQGETVSVYEAMESVFEPLRRTERELAAVNAQLATAADAALIERQQQLQEAFESGGGLVYRSRAAATLRGLGFDDAQFSQPVSTLSGGQRAKVALGRLLLSDTNLLLLDEPTNHLDIPSVEWLETFLRSYTGAVIVVSHDRYFLDRVTTRTMELENESLYCTGGNYTAHKEQRAKDAEVAERHYKTTQRAIKKLEENIALLRQWNREKSIRAAESREKRLDRLREQQVELPTEQKALRFGFTAETVSGNDVLSAGELTMGFAEPLFHDLSFSLYRGERVFLLGPNGCGKTTLFRLITGEQQAQRGYIRLGSRVSIGYYDQIQEHLDYDKTALDQLWDAYPRLTETELRSALATFRFYGDEVFKPIRQCSGGERARLLLLKLMLAHDNLLLLDEPTNHLDIASREALEEALENYDGTLFVISHDRYFINRMATRILRLEPTECRSYPGNYDDYMQKRQGESHAPSETAVSPDSPGENRYLQRKAQESAKRKAATRVRRLEEEIAAVEQDCAALRAELELPEVAADYEKVTEIGRLLEEKESLLEEKNDSMGVGRRRLGKLAGLIR